MLTDLDPNFTVSFGNMTYRCVCVQDDFDKHWTAISTKLIDT